MADKLYLTPESLLKDSFFLGAMIKNSSYKPNFIAGIWRGGTPVGIAVQEYLKYHGISTDHIPIRTSAYQDNNKIGKQIKVYLLGYLVENCNSNDNLLIVDDVYDTGLSIEAVIENLRKLSRKNCPDIKIATVYYKPSKNQTKRIPDFFVHTTEKWIVFPHELQGLTKNDILKHKKLTDIKQLF